MRAHSAFALAFSVLLACGVSTAPTDGVEVGAVPDLRTPETRPMQPTRLQPVFAQADDGSLISPVWWWWNPNETYRPDYVIWLNGALAELPRSAPYSYEPHLDRDLGAFCLFYQTLPGSWSCLPGWVQQAAPGYVVNGFYADPTCTGTDQYRYALPASEEQQQRWLVLYDARTQTYGVHVALEDPSPVYVRFFDAQGPRCAAAPSSLRYFEAGDSVALTRFVQLVSLTAKQPQ